MTIEIILPALEPAQWVAGIFLSVVTFIFGTFGALFLYHREQTEDLCYGIGFTFFTILFLFVILNIFEVITVVFQ